MTTPLSRFIRSIDANRTVKDALAAAISSVRPRSRVSVTDLVNPMQAFFRWTHPEIRPSPERLQVMMAGTGFHDVFGRVVSTEEFLEQLLEFEDIVGKVDIYEDVPVEVKTTSSIPDDIYAGRGSYFEQLGMYCTMAGRDTGRLFVYQRHSGDRSPDLKVYETRFLDMDKISEGMRTRRDLFRDALKREDPSGLPRCEWFRRGCDYSRVCGCAGADPMAPLVAREDVQITSKEDIADDLKRQLSSTPQSDSGLRLNDLVFPRKAALRRAKTTEEDGEDEGDAESYLTDIQRQGFRYALYNALRYGSPGQFKGVPIRLGSVDARVQTHRDVPTILRTPPFKSMVERDRLPDTFPHYFDRLALECALTNIRRGRLILYYERIPGEKFMVYDVMFRNRDQILAEGSRRLELLESGASHLELPPCPAWMAKLCEFAPDCGCGEKSPEDASQGREVATQQRLLDATSGSGP